MSVHVMSEVWTLDVGHAEQAVLLALADHANDDGGDVYPSLLRVAWKTGYSERQVRRIVRDLQASGVLVEVAKATRHKPVEYRIDTSAAPRKPSFEDYQAAARGDKMSAQAEGGQTEPPGRTSGPARADIAVSAEPSVEPSEEPTAPPDPPQAGGNGHRRMIKRGDPRLNPRANGTNPRALAAGRLTPLCDLERARWTRIRESMQASLDEVAWMWLEPLAPIGVDDQGALVAAMPADWPGRLAEHHLRLLRACADATQTSVRLATSAELLAIRSAA